MKCHFSNNPDEVQWLKDTALRGVELGQYNDFSSHMLYGDKVAPARVVLYKTTDPDHNESHALVTFVYDLIYCTIDYR